MLKLVPFNTTWINHDKIDIHAIYRRPHLIEDQYGEKAQQQDPNGLLVWDLTGPLPVKQHNKWTAKGYEYVTLANRESLLVAARHSTIEGDWHQFDQHKSGGPWNYRLYAEGQESATTLEAEQLRADVERFGSEAVEAIRQQREPHFKLPAHLQGVSAGGRASKHKGAELKSGQAAAS